MLVHDVTEKFLCIYIRTVYVHSMHDLASSWLSVLFLSMMHGQANIR